MNTILRDRRGATTIEYALLAALIALSLFATLTPLGHSLAREFTAISRTGFAPASPQGCHRVDWTGLDAKLVNDTAPKQP